MGRIIRMRTRKAKFPMVGNFKTVCQTIANRDRFTNEARVITNSLWIISCKFSFSNQITLIYLSLIKDGVECYGISILLENETTAIRVKLRGAVFL
jgi:hypothetical protein